MTYYIYTDGGCRDNPGGKGAYSAIIFTGTNPFFITGYEENTTNQRMELKSAIVGLKQITKRSKIKLFSDSAYLCNCFINVWYENWIKNGWKTASGSLVANKDLWEELIKLVEFHESVTFIKVKGHSDNIFNNKCDTNVNDILDFKELIDELSSNKKLKKER